MEGLGISSIHFMHSLSLSRSLGTIYLVEARLGPGERTFIWLSGAVSVEVCDGFVSKVG